MKVTLINHSDSLGGASTVTFRLMEALVARGVDAHMLVVHKGTDSPRVHRVAPAIVSRVPFLAEHLRIFRANGHSRDTLFKISTATDGLPLSHHRLVRKADAIILNWVNQGMLSLGEIQRIATQHPTLWTLHDMWNLTGVCHHAGDCRNYLTHCHDCPLLGRCAAPDDISARTFDRKAAMYRVTPLHMVAVSRWLADRARESALTADIPVSVISNPFESWSPISKSKPGSRGEAGLPWKGRIVLVCAARLDDPIKNLPGAIEALNTLRDTDAVAVFVGECRHREIFDSLLIPYYHLGPVYDKERLHAIFNGAEVVLSASHYESFGATLLEAQAAGAVPVGYVHDGRADIIDDGVNGYAAGEGLRTLGEALRLALARPIPHTRLYAAAARFSYDKTASHYMELLQEITGK